MASFGRKESLAVGNSMLKFESVYVIVLHALQFGKTGLEF